MVGGLDVPNVNKRAEFHKAFISWPSYALADRRDKHAYCKSKIMSP